MELSPNNQNSSTGQWTLSNMKCKVCESVFTLTGDRVPRLLLCGHSLCHLCLTRLAMDSESERTSSSILCPFDRRSTYLPPGGVNELNKNFALLEVLETMQNDSNSPSNSSTSTSSSGSRSSTGSQGAPLSPNSMAGVTRKCDENDLHVATLYCLTCATNLCLQCSEAIHSTRTLSRHKRIPICDAPSRQRPQCLLHPGHPVELVCLEPGCQIPSPIQTGSVQSSSTSQVSSQIQLQLPMMCYLCRDFSSHKGHKFNLLSHEAESIKGLLTNCLNIINNFSDDVTNYIRRLNACMQLIEGTSTRSPTGGPSSSSFLGSDRDLNLSVVGVVSPGSNTQLSNVRGTALVARQQVHDYFEDLRHNLRRQEEVALSVVNTFVREKKLALQQSMQTLTMILSQLTSTESDLKRQSTLGDVDLIIRRSEISRLVDAAQWQQSQLQDLLTTSSNAPTSTTSSGTNTSATTNYNTTGGGNNSSSSSTASGGNGGGVMNLAACDPSIPVTFTRDNRVHIGAFNASRHVLTDSVNNTGYIGYQQRGPKIEMRLVMLGLNNAGKTSILFKLKQNEFVPTTLPTIGFNVETIEYKNLQFNIWDVGGDPKLRPLWKHYYLNTQALIFVVDSSDRARMSEAQSELSRLMLEKDLRSAILLVLASKQDVRDSVGVEILTNELNLHKICCGRKWHIQACDAQTGVGLADGLDWLSRQLVWAGVVDVCPHAPAASSSTNPDVSHGHSHNENGHSTITGHNLAVHQSGPSPGVSPNHRSGETLAAGDNGRTQTYDRISREVPTIGLNLDEGRRADFGGLENSFEQASGSLTSASSQTQMYSSMATTNLNRDPNQLGSPDTSRPNRLCARVAVRDYDLDTHRQMGEVVQQLEYSSLIGRNQSQSNQLYNEQLNPNSFMR